MTDSFEFTFIGGREENQDAVVAIENENHGLYIVADGLGGHRNGSMASQCIITKLVQAWISDPEWNTEKLLHNVRDTNQALLTLQQQTQSNAKSTLALLTTYGTRVLWAYSGDSRIYRLRDGEIHQITEDHSVAYKKYKSGIISKSQIATDEDQSSLLRTLGSQTRWEPDVYEDKLLPEDSFLLCSDGFWEYISDEEMLIDWLKASSAENWARLMLQRIMPRVPAGNDNLSVITIIRS